MTDDWRDLTDWWLAEIAGDPAYRKEVLPLLLELLEPRSRARYLELGCGEGQAMRVVAEAGARVVGCDYNLELLAGAAGIGPTVGCRLPDLGWVRPGSFDGAYATLVIEHVEELPALFAGAAAAVRTGGSMVLVANHPLFTAPGSGPVVDPTDGEVFWRWGNYLEGGSTEEPAGAATVRFHHRPLGTVFNAAASAGWSLQRVAERAAAGLDDGLLADQQQIPRLLGVRWTKL